MTPKPSPKENQEIKVEILALEKHVTGKFKLNPKEVDAVASLMRRIGRTPKIRGNLFRGFRFSPNEATLKGILADKKFSLSAFQNRRENHVESWSPNARTAFMFARGLDSADSLPGMGSPPASLSLILEARPLPKILWGK